MTVIQITSWKSFDRSDYSVYLTRTSWNIQEAQIVCNLYAIVLFQFKNWIKVNNILMRTHQKLSSWSSSLRWSIWMNSQSLCWVWFEGLWSYSVPWLSVSWKASWYFAFIQQVHDVTIIVVGDLEVVEVEYCFKEVYKVQ